MTWFVVITVLSVPVMALVEIIRAAIPTSAMCAGGHPDNRVVQALRIVV